MLGISIYPSKSTFEKDKTYLDLAAKYGFKRIFTSMLEVTPENKDHMIATFKKTIQYANGLGFKTTLDVNPRSFEVLGIDYHHLDLIEDIGAAAIRLDSNFDGLTESLISFEDSSLNIELNLSSDTKNIANIISYEPNMRRLSGCHNFYPQRFTGLGVDFFTKTTSMYKKMGLRTAAFVTSQNATFGPHAFADGLPTLEMHRDLDIAVQAKHLFATGLIDDVLISNCYASEDELKRLSEINQDQLVLSVDEEQPTNTEAKILYDFQHFNRGDINEYSHRSTFVKLQFKERSIPPRNTVDELHRGDITIGNDDFGQYKAEVNIVKQDMPNTGHLKNLVGHVAKDEAFLIDYIKPWSKLRFTPNDR